MTDEQKQNLKKLANYLDYEELQFNFAQNCYYNERRNSASAIGNGPNAGIPKLEGESWPQYCRRVFGVSVGDGGLGTYMFSPLWHDIDNNPCHTAQRIRNVLAGYHCSIYDVDWESYGKFAKSLNYV